MSEFMGLFKAPIIAAALVVLAACAATSEPRIVTREVQVPVAVKCGADPGPRPAYADTDEAIRAVGRDLYRQVQLLLGGRKQRMAREVELEAASAGCR